MQDNAAQLEYWNGPAGQRWAALQERIDANLGKITDAFFAFANVRLAHACSTSAADAARPP